MKVQFYTDIKLKGAAGIGARTTASMLMALVHHHLTKRPGTIAMAFPEAVVGNNPGPGKHIRVFSESDEQLEYFLDELEKSPVLALIQGVIRIRPVPINITKLVSYPRFVIGSRKRGKKDHDEYYARRLQRRNERLAESFFLPSLLVSKSASTGQTYPVCFECHYSETATEQGQINGYGLSQSASPVWLPHF